MMWLTTSPPVKAKVVTGVHQALRALVHVHQEAEAKMVLGIYFLKLLPLLGAPPSRYSQRQCHTSLGSLVKSQLARTLASVLLSY